MPSLSPDLATALRNETPNAPSQVRERVVAITATPQPPRRFTTRRVLAFAAPAVAALSLAVAVAVGLNSAIDSNGGSNPSAAGRESALRNAPAPSLSPELKARGEAQDRATLTSPGVPAAKRAQDYRASLTLLVDGTDELSATTQRTLRIARRLGGYVLSVQYRTPEPGEGTAAVRLRIPVTRVQAAIVQFNGLGRILSQETQISDLQQRLDELTREIRKARGDKARIAQLRRERAAISRQAAFATIAIDLTTHEPESPKAAPGRFDRALDDATGVLTAELAIGAYVLIVASPLLLLLIAGFFGNRAYRRHADQRLLERA